MKRSTLVLTLAFTLALVSFPVLAQQLTLPPGGDNQRSEVTQWMGLVTPYGSP